MDDKEYYDEDLEKDLDEALKESKRKTNVFRIIADEKTALNMKEKRFAPKFRVKKQNDKEIREK